MRQVHNQKQLKLNNVSRIFCHLRDNGALIKSEIAKDLDLSFVTVTTICNDLVASGYAEITDEFESSGGRKPIGVRFIPDSKYICVIDLSLSNNERIVILDLDLNIIDEVMFEVDKSLYDTTTYLRYIAAKLDYLKLKIPDAKRKIIGVVIAIPGMVNRISRKVETCNNALIENIDLKLHMSELLGLPVYIENDANATALGYVLDSKKPDNVLYLHFTDGLGLGIVIDKKIYDGYFGTAGELSSFPALSLDNKICSIEEIVVRSKALQLFKENKVIDSDNEQELLDLFSIFVGTNDPFCQRLFNNITNAIGILTSTLIDIINPQHVILGGNWGHMIDKMIPKITTIVKNRSLTAQKHDIWIENKNTDCNYTIKGCGEQLFQRWLRSFDLR